MVWTGCVLRRGSGLKPIVGPSSRSFERVRARIGRAVLALFLASIPFSTTVCRGQDSPDLPVSARPKEKPPIFSDVTIWTAQTVGSTNLMSEYEGQRMFAMGVGLRRHFHTFRYADMSWNLGLSRCACRRCRVAMEARITTGEADHSGRSSRREKNGG